MSLFVFKLLDLKNPMLALPFLYRLPPPTRIFQIPFKPDLRPTASLSPVDANSLPFSMTLFGPLDRLSIFFLPDRLLSPLLLLFLYPVLWVNVSRGSALGI